MLVRAADEPRRGDLDGRGNLTDTGLAEFCSFFLETCLDQVRYMRGLLDIEGLAERLLGYVELSVARRELPKQAGHLLREATLVERGLLMSSSPKGPLRLGFPSYVAPYYFPRLFPAELEDGMRSEI